MRDNIDELIKQSIKAQLHKRTEVLRAIKNEFLKWETAKNAKPLDEIAVLNRMAKQRQESIEAYTANGRTDLASDEQAELEIIQGFLPKKATSKDIRNAVCIWALEHNYADEDLVNNIEYSIDVYIPKKRMGDVIKHVKSVLVNVDGKELSEIVKEYLV